MGRQSIFDEFLAFLRQEKKWWIPALLLIAILLGCLVFFASSSARTPFLYPGT